MKIIFYLLAIILMTGCAGNSSKKETAEELESVEIQKIDSVSSKLDSARGEIEKLSGKVDQLIDEL
ncbi:MAG: hypothetical protein JXB00_02410 [Bacteroidales bacterium]|nr:hypothetical protein [Bacteroidales bacterium]